MTDNLASVRRLDDHRLVPELGRHRVEAERREELVGQVEQGRRVVVLQQCKPCNVVMEAG